MSIKQEKNVFEMIGKYYLVAEWDRHEPTDRTEICWENGPYFVPASFSKMLAQIHVGVFVSMH